MIRERILSNLDAQHGGGVAVTCPSEWGVQALMHGGAWRNFHKDFWKVQIARMVARNVKEDAAHTYALTMMTGGVSRSRAIDIIAARDLAHWAKAIDVIDVSELPETRRYRNAWRRSPNGGPVWVDDAARVAIDEARMWAAYTAHLRGSEEGSAAYGV